MPGEGGSGSAVASSLLRGEAPERGRGSLALVEERRDVIGVDVRV